MSPERNRFVAHFPQYARQGVTLESLDWTNALGEHINIYSITLRDRPRHIDAQDRSRITSQADRILTQSMIDFIYLTRLRLRDEKDRNKMRRKRVRNDNYIDGTEDKFDDDDNNDDHSEQYQNAHAYQTSLCLMTRNSRSPRDPKSKPADSQFSSLDSMANTNVVTNPRHLTSISTTTRVIVVDGVGGKKTI